MKILKDCVLEMHQILLNNLLFDFYYENYINAFHRTGKEIYGIAKGKRKRSAGIFLNILMT